MFWIIYDAAAIIYAIVGAIFFASSVFGGFLFGVMLTLFVFLIVLDIERYIKKRRQQRIAASYHRIDNEWRK